MGLESMAEERLQQLRGKLNRRQVKILTDYLKQADDQDDGGSITPPVPAELEASIRMRKRGAWLPWEAEAIRKIERWRTDVGRIAILWSSQTVGFRPETLSKVAFMRSSLNRNVTF